MRRLLVGFLAAAVGLLSGCVKAHIETDIVADGSGTCTITYAMPRDVADAVAAMGHGGAGTGMEMPKLGDLSRETLEARCQRVGARLLEFRQTDDAGGVNMITKVGFTDLAQLSRLLNDIEGSATGGDRQGWRIDPLADGNYVLRTVTLPGDTPEPATGDDAAAVDLDELPDALDLSSARQHLSVLMGNIDKLDIRLAITVPGEVIHSNAMEVEGRTSIWTVNAANMMQADASTMEPEIRFSGQGLRLKSAP
jgi:hypothetical protein